LQRGASQQEGYALTNRVLPEKAEVEGGRNAPFFIGGCVQKDERIKYQVKLPSGIILTMCKPGGAEAISQTRFSQPKRAKGTGHKFQFAGGECAKKA
jgi:hypothetical protein